MIFATKSSDLSGMVFGRLTPVDREAIRWRMRSGAFVDAQLPSAGQEINEARERTEAELVA